MDAGDKRGASDGGDSILKVDGLGGLIAGALVLVLRHWVARHGGLPMDTIVFMIAANLTYGAFATTLAFTPRSRRPRAAVSTLAAANIGWAPCCVVIAVMNAGALTALGYLHVLGEGVYVGGLGLLEWSRRDQLARSNAS